MLRSRYVNEAFLDARMLPEQLHFRSSARERCIETTIKVGLAMFSGIPVSVHTVPGHDDFMLFPHLNCRRLNREKKEKLNINNELYDKWTQRGKPILAILQGIMERELKYAKYYKNSSENVLLVDSLIIEKNAGAKVPEWFDENAEREGRRAYFHGLNLIAGTGPYHNPNWIRPTSGLLLEELTKHIKRKIECDQTRNCKDMKKFYAYGTHDMLLMALLESIGAKDAALGEGQNPEFIATLILELWKRDGRYYIKALFRRYPNSNRFFAITQSITGCSKVSDFCSSDTFIGGFQQYKTTHPKDECHVNKLSKKLKFYCLIKYLG
ncbi:hypothetical protein WR25_23132 isoform E [Diploscapter pachys]|uniref:acid phosphatase n=2 Tax=Diploscapter pachys TaxID=2018661 RepID=A0A2A2JGB0_9BILA|nr:hypothetical protein WR25_23132 isoform E [Diploscapter pachys]